MQTVLSHIHLLGSEGLARETLSALREKRMVEACILACTFSSLYGSIHPEAHILCATILTQLGRNTAALHFLEKAIIKNPGNTEWLELAIRTSWNEKSEQSSKQRTKFLAILKNTFISHPSLPFLSELSKHGTPLQGSCGVYDGNLRAWLWLANGKEFSLKTQGISLPNGSMRKYQTDTHTLYEITIPLLELPTAYSIDVTVDNTHVCGSPVYCSPTSCAKPKTKNKTLPGKKIVTIIIPCFDGYTETLSCLGSVFASQKHNTTQIQILAMWDHGSNTKLFSALERLAKKGKIILQSTPGNMGFLGCVNEALSLVPNGNVILLNADTLVHGNWVDRMETIAQEQDAATVTPFGSYAEQLSYPGPNDRGFVHTIKDTAHLDCACSKLPQSMHKREIPVGMGFCMLITRRALKTLGGLDGFRLFRGYGEESDFCLRACAAKLKNYAACNVYVAHLGGRSFGASKRAYVAQNNSVIRSYFPEYDTQYNRFILQDPLATIRDHIARFACTNTLNTLHIYPWSAQYIFPKEKEYRTMRPNTARCFVLACGSATKLLFRINQGIALADINMLLPNDTKELQAFLTKCGFTSFPLHGLSIPSSLQAILSPLASKNQAEKSIVYETMETINEEELPKDPATFFVIPPLRINELRTLFRFAEKHPWLHFLVYNLRNIWGTLSYPDNICELPDIDDLSSLNPSALLFAQKQEEGSLTLWTMWLENHAVHNLALRQIPNFGG